MIKRITLAFALSCVATAAAAAPRLSFIRTIPAAHAVPGDLAALIYAIGDTDKVDTFVDTFVQHVNRSDFLRVEEATDRKTHLVGERPDEAAFRRIRREHPADAYIGLKQFTCETSEHTGVGSTHDVDGTRIKRPHTWVDARCSGRLDIVDGPTARRLSSIRLKGEGTSPRVSAITEEERGIATEQAARFAAIAAAEAIMPRRIKESIELDDKAPAFDEGFAMIAASRLSEARSVWEGALRANPSSAPLHFNLAAVCEASGDGHCAQEHYQRARRLDPKEKRYAEELALFQRRAAESRK